MFMSPSARFVRRPVVRLVALASVALLGACESAEERSNEVFIVDYAPQVIETKSVCGGAESRMVETYTLGEGGRIVDRRVESFDADGTLAMAERFGYAHDALGRISRIDAYSGEPADPALGRRWRLVSTTGRAWVGDALSAEREVRFSSTGAHAVEHVRTYTRDAAGHLVAIEHAIHDAGGRRTATSTAKTDAEGRLRELRVDDRTLIVWTRDAEGRVTRETTTSGDITRTESFTYTADYVTTWRRACESETPDQDCGWTETYTCTPTVDGQGMLTEAVCTGQDRAGCAVTRTLTYSRDGRSASVDLAPDGWPTHRADVLLRDAADLALLNAD